MGEKERVGKCDCRGNVIEDYRYALFRNKLKIKKKFA
jgi:hypothetical protein